MNRDEAKQYLEDNGFPTGRELLANKHKMAKDWLSKETAFLDEHIPKPKMAIRLHCIEFDIHEVPDCANEKCNNKVKSLTTQPSHNGVYRIEFTKFCSSKCSRTSQQTLEKTRKTCREKFGADSYMQSDQGKQQYKDTMVSRYGVKHSSQLPDFHDKRRKTTYERYGVREWMKDEEKVSEWKERFREKHGEDNPMKVGSIKDKVFETNTDRYGESVIFKTDHFKEMSKQTFIEHYGVPHPMQSESVKQKVRQSNLNSNEGVLYNQRHLSEYALSVLNDEEKLSDLYNKFGFIRLVADYLGCHFSSVQRAMDILSIPAKQAHKSSIGELEVNSFIESLGFTTKQSDRTILDGFESDIVVNEVPLIVEFNGTYYHSSKFKSKSYHQSKSILAHQKGYDLIHVYEDDWEDDNQRLKVQEKIRSKLKKNKDKIYARKTTVSIPSKEEVKNLMNQHHIQGYTGYSFAIGLYRGGNLISCATFKKTNKHGIYDLNRFVSSTPVVGGMSKIVSYLKKNVNFKEIFTYAHLDYSRGDLYEKSGFSRDKVTPPGLWYIRKGYVERYRREKFMKHKLPSLFENVDMSKTEKEIMEENGFIPFHDAGSIKFSLTKSNP